MFLLSNTLPLMPLTPIPPKGWPTSHNAHHCPLSLPDQPFSLLKELVVSKTEHFLEKDRDSSTKNQEAILEPCI